MSTTLAQPAETAEPLAAEGWLTRRSASLFLLILSAAIYLGNAGFPALLDDADASHAQVAWEMLQRHDWVILYMNGIRYLMKAPLHYWTVAFSYAVFGKNDFASRLPDALAMIALVMLVNAFARRYFGVRAGFYAGLAVCTGAGFFLFTRIMIPEAIYALEFSAIFYLFLLGWTGALRPRPAYWSVAALTGLALLTRGLVGVIFPSAVIFLFLAVTSGWRQFKETFPLLSSVLIFLAVGLPWHVLASMRAATFSYSYFINEHINRALGTRYPPDYEAVPLWLWLGAHLIWFFPWSLFLPGIVREWPRWREHGHLAPEAQARLLLFLWGGFILFFFSMTFGSRMEYYAFGGWPAIAMLLGIGLAHAEEAGKRWLRGTQAALAIAGAAIAAVLIALVVRSAHVIVHGDIASLLEEHANNFYRVSMAHIMDLTPQAFALLRLPATLAAGAFLFGFGAAWWFRRRNRALAATLCTAITMAVFLFAANIALGTFNPYLSSRALYERVAPAIAPSDVLAIYGEFDASSAVAFYSNRRLLVWNGRYNNLEAGSRYPDAPPVFVTDAEFTRLWDGSQRVWLFVPENKREDAAKRLAALPHFVAARSGGKAAYTNRPFEIPAAVAANSAPARK
jgi:4-amino-4-deoxy-L-arabinose transferase-like glycosyltransferase